MRQMLIAALAGLFLSGCPGFGTKTAAELAGVDSVTYETHVKAVLATRCLACHGEPTRNGAPASSAMASYETAKALAGPILERTVILKDMPPGVPLNDEEMGIISAWVEQGAPQGTPTAEEADAGPEMISDAGIEPPLTPSVTYDDDIEELLAQACTFCHGENLSGGAPRGSEMHTYETAKALAERIYIRSVVIKTMPPGTPLSEEQQALITAWFEAGAPKTASDVMVPPMTGGQTTPMTGGDSNGGGGNADAGGQATNGGGAAMPGGNNGNTGTSATWNDNVRPIMEAKCSYAGCHDDGTRAAGLNLETYTGYQAGGLNGDLTGGGNADMSLFMDRLLERNGTSLMPLGGPALGQDEISTIEEWLNAGSPEGN